MMIGYTRMYDKDEIEIVCVCKRTLRHIKSNVVFMEHLQVTFFILSQVISVSLSLFIFLSNSTMSFIFNT